jgi:3-methyladenine DNA glycosylase AlkD
MTPKEFYQDFVDYCSRHANPDTVKKYARYFKENYDAYGLTQALMDEKIQAILAMKDFNLELLVKSAPLFFRNGKYETTSIIISLLNRMHKQYTKELFVVISSWFGLSIHNWAHADMMGMYILPSFMKQGLMVMKDFKPWLNAPYKFQRRCVPVTLIKSAKAGEPLKPMFEFIKPLMKDDQREVHQGVGWFLKECWKLKPAEMEAFLLPYKDTAPRLIFQIACEKMTAENKQRFKKAR